MIVVLSSGTIALVVAVCEAWQRGWRLADDSGIAAKPLRRFDIRHATIRFLGFGMTVAAAAFIYWLLPEYHGSFYDPFWHLLRLLVPVALPVAALNFFWSDSRLSTPDDAYWELGRIALRRGDRPIAWQSLKHHGLSWMVKVFFLPLMVVYAAGQISDLGPAFSTLVTKGALHGAYGLIFRLCYTIDLLFCVAGYILTIRVLDTHIRSTDGTVFGWLVALICYQPFYSVIGSYYLRYDDNRPWTDYFAGHPLLSQIWGAGIIVLVAAYALTTVSFGLRFSNLTNRGIITSGPYRFFKHPAYLSKNLSWWMSSVPFLSSSGWTIALRHCLLLLMLNAVYWLRARTEERHLSADPTYAAYAAWIAEHGLTAKLVSGTRRLAKRWCE